MRTIQPMFDFVPGKVWLLLLLCALAFQPARYVVRHVMYSPTRRDITQPPDDTSWRSTRALAWSFVLLAGLLALAIFVFTPTAAAFAQSASFQPILMLGLGAVALWSVVNGYLTGTVEPMVRGTSWTFRRTEQPKRYWASMAWNGLVGGGLLAVGAWSMHEAPKQDLRERCLDWRDERPPADRLTACDTLLADREGDADERARILGARGSAHYGLGNYRRAGADYAAAVRLDPQESSTHFNLGLVHRLANEQERAIREFSTAIRIDPKYMNAYIERGGALLDAGRLTEALSDFTRAHQLHPGEVRPLALRGLTYAWMDDRDRAEADFAAVRRTDPRNQIVLHGESVLAFRSADYERAIALLDSAVAADPSDAWAFEYRANAHERLHADDKARADRATAARLWQQRDVKGRR